MGSTLSLFSQSFFVQSNANPTSMRKNPRSQTAKEEVEQLYKLMKAMECKENQTPRGLQELMDHWYKLEKKTRSHTAQEMLEHFYKLGKACEYEENNKSQTPRQWKSNSESEPLEHWYKQIAVSECNEKLLLFAMKCGWVAVNSTTEEIMKRKRDLWKCIPVAFSFYRCLNKLNKKYGDMDMPIDDFKEPYF